MLVDARAVTQRLKAAKVLLDTGMLAPTRPSRAIRSMGVVRRWGPTPAAGYGSVAARYPDRAAIVDERGLLTFAQLDRRTNALARGLAGPGRARATAWRSCAATIAASSRPRSAVSKLGANALFLNTAFAGPQIAEVLAREDPVALIYDEEFTGLWATAPAGARACCRGAIRTAPAPAPARRAAARRADREQRRPAPAAAGRARAAR